MSLRQPWKERHYDRESLFKRIFSKRIIDPSTGCWLWPYVNDRGYALLTFEHYGRKTTLRLHRLIAWLYLGYDGDSKLEVCHRCNVKACFNPAHLYIATHQQNMIDARRDKLWKRERGWKIRKQHPGTETIQ